MRIAVVGINHKSADLGYREAFAKACYNQLGAESSWARELSCVPLLTCHRTEVYFSAEDLAAAHSCLLQILRKELPFAFEHKLYAYFGRDCFIHLAKVTAGLDSMVLAESEIQRQVKHSYEQSCLHYALPTIMHYLFQKSLKLGKSLRSQPIFPKGQVTIAKMIYEISSHLFTDLHEKQILLIGNSEINRKVLNYLQHKGVGKISLCTRSVLSAREMGLEALAQLCDWSHIAQWGKYPMVISGTNTSSFLIRHTEAVSDTRLIFDLGVPRNVDAALSRHPQIVLLNIDELGQMMDKRQENQNRVLQDLEIFIQEKVEYYIASYKEKRMQLCT